jgi:hypothetical protein
MHALQQAFQCGALVAAVVQHRRLVSRFASSRAGVTSRRRRRSRRGTQGRGRRRRGP